MLTIPLPSKKKCWKSHYFSATPSKPSFADDWVLITQEYGDMEFMVRMLLEEYEKWGLKINIKNLCAWVVEKKPKI